MEGGEIKGTGLGQDGVEKGRWVSGQEDGVACVEDGVAIGRPVAGLEGGCMREKLRGSAVRRLLKLFVQEKTFVLSSIKRAVHKFLLQKPELNRASSILGMLKPNGLHVTEMFDSNESFFSCGEAVLGVGSHNFKLEVMDEEHIAACGRVVRGRVRFWSRAIFGSFGSVMKGDGSRL